MSLGDALPGWTVERWQGPPLPPETADTFRENARGKALHGRAEGDPDAWMTGEDSGLEVAALHGAPGIFSARYAGEDATDEANVDKLLAALHGVEDRRARYVCELVALGPAGEEIAVNGTLEGSIAPEPRGEEGFGYDPVFVPDGETQTAAELGNAWKSGHSHRARAAQALAVALGTDAPGR